MNIMKTIIERFFIYLLTIPLLLIACDDDFLDRGPLDTPTLETFWETTEHAEMWVNSLYLGLGDVQRDFAFEGYSDNAWGRAGWGANNIANGLFTTEDAKVWQNWDYRYIRLCLEFFEYIDLVPDISQSKLDELTGQVRFILAFQYYRLVTLYRDVPLVTKPLMIDESDVPKNSKEDVLKYILDQLDLAIPKLPITWPSSENGRITKGAALALKTRVLLFNNRWAEAAATAKEIMNLNEYELHPNFEELFVAEFNNQTKEVILAQQYAAVVNTHQIVRAFAPVYLGGFALILPTPQLEQSFEMIDGLSIHESPLYDHTNPFDNRDPRYYHTFIWHGRDYNGPILDLTGSEYRFAFTYLYFLKYVADLKDRFWPSHVNTIIFRYADVLLMYAEAQNEASGPDNSIYEALDLIRERAGMPPADRDRYGTQATLREFIRNERRVELAGEGLRYFDIIRWRIAEEVLNSTITSLDLENWSGMPVDSDGNPLLPLRPVATRTFNPNKHYVWPIPQNAIDRAVNLEQHPEWE